MNRMYSAISISRVEFAGENCGKLGRRRWSSIGAIQSVLEVLVKPTPTIRIAPEIPNNSYQHCADQRRHDLIESVFHDVPNMLPLQPLGQHFSTTAHMRRASRPRGQAADSGVGPFKHAPPGSILRSSACGSGPSTSAMGHEAKSLH